MSTLKKQDRCYSRKISSQSACDVLWFLQIPILTYHFAPSKQTSGLVPIVSLYNLFNSCNLRRNRFLPVKKGRICSRQRRVLLSIYLWNMRQFEEKKYLHVQRKKYYYILTYNKNVYHVALMSLVCAKIEMMLLVSYLVSVVMLYVKENKYVCGFWFWFEITVAECLA